MAEGDGFKSVSKLTCSICLDTFTHPKLLPCFHSFCLTCLEDYATRTQKNNQFDCPLCRVTIDIPVGGVDGFLSNIYIECGQIDLPFGDIVCDVCGHGTNANYRCIECEENFCEPCTNAHMKMKMTKEHKLLEVTELLKGGLGKIKSKSFCVKHNGEELKMLCKDCDKLLCIVCKLTEHENHSSIDIATEAEEKRNRLSSLLANSHERVKSMNKIVKHMEENEEQLQRKFESDVDALEGNIEENISEIRSEGQRVKQQLKITLNEDLRTIKQHKSEVNSQAKRCESLIGTVSNLLEMGCNAEILKSCSDLMTRLADISETSRPMASACRYMSLRYSVEQIIPKFHVDDESFETFNEVQIINVLRYITDVGNSNKCRGIAVNHQMGLVSFLDTTSLHKYTFPSPDEGMQDEELNEYGDCAGITMDNKGDIFFTTLSNKAISKYAYPQQESSVFQTTNMYPHGIAFRSRDSSHGDEILVCVIDDSDPMSQKYVEGYVKALLTDDSGNSYKIIAEHCPAPTSIAISKVSGMICLGYPAARKVALLTSDGQLNSEFQGSYEAGIPESFCPMSVCFDKLNGVIIADYGNGTVIRINEYGGFHQVLMDECKPLAVAMEEDNVLWVGDEIKSIKRYQLSS